MRLPAAALGLLLVLAGALYGLRGPRLTMVNAGLLVDYPPGQGLALLLAAIGLGLWAWAAPRVWMRWIAVAAACVTATVALARGVYRLEAADAGVTERGLLGSTQVAWKGVRRVDAGAALVLVWGPDDTQVRIATGGFTPAQRAILDRTISRRVREAQATTSGATGDPGGPGPQRR